MNYLKYIPTLGPIGYLPAPGTCASAVTFIVLYAIRFGHYAVITQWVWAIILFIGSSLLISFLLRYFNAADPSEIVLDELVGSMIAVCGVAPTMVNYCVAFILFRLFDIFKPLGIKKLEQLPGGWGVVSDDVAAGCAALIFIQIMALIF
ncbi:MAG: phosphatidylglycerophosphatase A [Candidatus Babeliales bacterium]